MNKREFFFGGTLASLAQAMILTFVYGNGEEVLLMFPVLILCAVGYEHFSSDEQ